MSQTANLMQELKAANVDVVVTVSYPAAAAAKASGVPTVIASGSGDPVKTGLVASLARPGGNVTGIADDAAALSTKRLGYLKALSPQLRKVAMLWNKDDLGMSQRYDASARPRRRSASRCCRWECVSLTTLTRPSRPWTAIRRTAY